MECFVFVVLSVEGVYQQNQSVSFVNVFQFDRMKVTIECVVLCALLIVTDRLYSNYIPIELVVKSIWVQYPHILIDYNQRGEPYNLKCALNSDFSFISFNLANGIPT